MQARPMPSCGAMCLSVCLSVTFVDSVETNKHVLKIYSPSGSHTILVFPYQTSLRYSDGEPPPPITGASNAGEVCRNRDSEPISGSVACCERLEWHKCNTFHSAATDRGKLMTLVAGKRQSLLMAGDDDEVYDKKPQR